jgi:hypothetical protein
VPLVASAPLQAPLAVQEVAFVLDHVRIEVLPEAIVAGLAESAAVGAGATVTVALTGAVVPPAPVQVSV